jgi:transcription antitermination factor NusG
MLPDCGRDPDTLRWTVVHTHPNREIWADENLNRAGYETYLPLYATTTGKPRRVVQRPLFPNYIFLALAPGQGWVAARYCSGVHKLCMAGERPNRVPDAALEAIRAGEDARRCLPSPGSLWAAGAPCRLANGSPIDGINAVVLRVTGDTARVHVLMFGELRDVVVRAECLVMRKDA